MDELSSLLKQWNLLHLHPILQDENITIGVLQIINHKDLYELTKKFKLGDKILFEFNVQKWRQQIEKPMTNANYVDLWMKPSTSRISNTTESPSQTSVDECSAGNSNVRLSNILKQNKSGIRIVETYGRYERFNEDQRSLLVTIIASFYHSNEIHMSLQDSYQMERQIIDMFPNEKLLSYRTEKRGKIYAKYNNMKRNPPFRNENDDPNVPIEDKKLNNIVSEENAKEAVHCLKYDNMDKEDFLEMWQSCSKYRIRQIFDEFKTLTEILKAWPQYKGPQGSKLIHGDFNIIIKDYVAIFDWESAIIKLYTLLSAGSYIKDPTIRSVLKNMDTSNAASKMSLFLMKTTWCLHGYLYSTSKFSRNDKDGKKTYGKYTIKDSQESFMYLAENIQELDNHITSLKKRGENIQPFIFAIGDVKLQAKEYEYFLYLDGTLLPFSDFQRAFDICFKSIHLFNLEYPTASSQFWTFIQVFFYNIKSANDIKYSKIVTLLNDLKQT